VLVAEFPRILRGRVETMRVLLVGARGMLGTDLNAVLAKRHEVIAPDRRSVDITDEEAVRRCVEAAEPDVIVLAAAYTDVERAEDDPETAFLVNETGTRHVAVAAQAADASLIYFSTDFVFDGKKGTAYTESDEPNPISVYGRSKLAGEKQAELAPRHCIIRTAWLYGPKKANFVEKIVGLAREQRRLSVTADEIGSPTYTLDLARAVDGALEKRMTGLYHVTNAGWCSRYDFATEIVKLAGLSNVVVERAAPGETATKAARPTFGVLSNVLWEKAGGPPMRHWKDALRAYLRDRRDRWTLLQAQPASSSE